MKRNINETDFREAVIHCMGWCSTCKDFTTESVEPDAKNYVCNICNNITVSGAENALIMGILPFSEEKDNSLFDCED